MWELQQADLRVSTVGKLFARFMDEWAYDSSPLLMTMPDTTRGYVLRNPENKWGQRYFDANTDWSVIAFRQRFHITIERQYREVFGPHPARIMYRSWQLEGELIWVAIAQLNFMWHSDERLLASLQEALKAGEFYQSEKTAETVIFV